MLLRIGFLLLGFFVCVTNATKIFFEDDVDDGHSRHMSAGESAQHDGLRQFTGHIPWITWRQLVRDTTVAKCALLSGGIFSVHPENLNAFASEVGNGMSDFSELRSESTNALCHMPIMLFFVRGECSPCKALLQDLGSSAEFELLSEYMTMVAAESIEEMTVYYPYPRPYFRHASLLSSGGSNKRRLKEEEIDALRKAFAGQGEYFPRVLFLFPHNGSVMPIFNQGVDSDPMHLHFYNGASSLVRSMMVALRTINEAVSFSKL